MKNKRILIAFSYDVITTFVVFFLAIALRFETLNPFQVKVLNRDTFLFCMVLGQVTLFLVTGLYRGVWRYSSLPDLVRVVKAASLGTFLSLLGLFFWNRLEGVPRSVVIIDYILLVIFLGGGRFLYRLWKDSNFQTKDQIKSQSKIEKVIIIGAGSAGNQLIREISLNPSVGVKVVGLLDDNEVKHGRITQGVTILGSIDKLSQFARKLNVSKVFIAIPRATGDEIKRIVDFCKESQVEFKTLPKFNDILSGKVELSLLRNINLEDLLGREAVKLDLNELGHMIAEKSVMITGAGGSIGSELCVQISKFKPCRVILFELSEFFLYELEMKISKKFPDIEFVPVIGDVRSRDRVFSTIKTYSPALIFHAAAYKHVPMMEKNPLEAIRTNIEGTQIVTEGALKYKVEKFVMVSTDKAVNPTNIMGTSKRIAEMICQKANYQSSETQFVTVRFGNVLGSNGSVIPLFKKQIQSGGPITVTHPDITRYFMSIPEACQLVLQTASMGKGGEIFVLEMGSPVKIVDLAKDLITLAGLEIDKDISIEYTGLRPGEKLYEELFAEEESLIETSHLKIRKANSRGLVKDFDENLNSLLELNSTSQRKDIYVKMMKLVKEFTPDELNLDGPKSVQ